MACNTFESGPQVSITYTEETDCGVTPPALLTPVINVQADKTGAAAGEMNFIIATGDWGGVEHVRKWQYVETTGFSNSVNNGVWLVLGTSGVSPSTLRVADPGALGVDEIAAAPNSVQIKMRTLRATGRQLDLVKDVLESEEVRPSRQRADVRHGFERVEGSIGYELSLVSYTDGLRAAFAADDWVTPDLTGTGNLGITAATPLVGQATIDRATNNWEDDGIRPGDIIETASFVNVENNRQWRVISVTAQNMVVHDPEEDAITEAAGAGPTMTYPGARIDIGTGTPRTFTMEQRFDGITQYRAYRGVAFNEMSWTISPEAIVSGDFTMLGMRAQDMVPTPINALDPVAPPLNSPFAAFDGYLFEGGEVSDAVTSLEFSINNNYELAAIVGQKGSPAVFDGVMILTGSLTVFLEDASLYNKFRNETESSIWVRLQDPNDANEFMNVVIPRVKYMTSEIDPPLNGPVSIDMGMEGLEASVRDIDGSLIPSTITIQSSTV